MNITYKEHEYELKYSYRAMMLFENITKKSFNTKTITDFITFLYCIILAQAKDEVIDYGEFLDWIDENHDIFNDYVKWLVDVYTEQTNKTPEREVKDTEVDPKN